MLVLLPLISFILLFLLLSNQNCWRSAVLLTFLAWGLITTVITEVLSLFRALSLGWVASTWALTCIALGISYYRLIQRRKQSNRTQNQLLSAEIDRKFFLSKPRLWIQVSGIAFIVAIVGLIALVAPPNLNDAMGYHMPRVMHWVQNHSVAHFPTNYAAQLFLSPWSTYAILHLQILSGSDQYANLVQWFGMVGSIIGVSLIAAQLGANIYGQFFASAFCATLPMGILQGSSAQNDYLAALWLVCLAYSILLTLQKLTEEQEQIGKSYFLLIGISLGLAVLTKGTAYIYAFPFLLWIFIVLLKSIKWQVASQRIALTLIPALLINIFLFIRNFEVFKTPLGKSPDYIIYTNRAISIPIFLSNIIRNIALQLSTPSPSINRLLINFWTQIHNILNVDISDPRTSSSKFQLNSVVTHGDLAGNPIHLFLIAISLIYLFFLVRRKFPHYKTLLTYALCIISGFLLFCLMLAWTPFHNRLHLPLFVLSSAFVGCIFSTVWKPRLVSAIATLLIVIATPWLFFNEMKPIIANSQYFRSGQIINIFNTERTDLYFMGQPTIKKPMIEAANFIKSQQCSEIGISFDRLNVYEYPLWILMQDGNRQPPRIQHVEVDNQSSKKSDIEPFNRFSPCVIYDTFFNAEEIKTQGSTYIRQFSSTPVNVLIRKGSGA